MGDMMLELALMVLSSEKPWRTLNGIVCAAVGGLAALLIGDHFFAANLRSDLTEPRQSWASFRGLFGRAAQQIDRNGSSDRTSFAAAGFISVILIATAAGAAEQGCDAYATYKRLPASFVEIASGELSAGPGKTGTIEFFHVSDGVCACTSVPAQIRDDAIRKHRFWSCRAATDDERPDPRIDRH
jgi:hypothetical protein